MLTINAHSIIQYISPNCESILGYTPGELTGAHLPEMIADDNLTFLEDIRLFIDKHPRPICEYRMRHKAGLIEWYSFKFSQIDDYATNEFLILCLARNINFQKEHETQLEYLSMHDQLTGVYNRAFFFEELKRIDQTNIYPLTVLTYDLDDFKSINDRFGHAAGDNALARTAKAVSQALRKNDVFARIGGDEFSILLPSTSYAEAAIIAQRIRQLIRCDNANSQQPAVSLSIGIATKNDSTTSLDSILQISDQRMYQEKKRKKSAAADDL